MFSKKVEDIFNTNVSFESDISFSEMKNISRILIHSLTKNIEILVKIIKKQTFENGATLLNPFKDGGVFYNNTLILKSINILGDDELLQIANTFKTEMQSSKYSSVSDKIQDPIKHLMYFTKYMYIPVRLNYNSIPSYLQTIYLKSWLTVIIILSFREEYINKYSEIYKNLDIYKKCINILLNNEETRIKMSNVSLQSVENILETTAAPNNGLHSFIQLFSKLIFHINIEIVNKFCPNYNLCQTVNKNYNGTWVSPLDPDVNNQISKMKNIISI